VELARVVYSYCITKMKATALGQPLVMPRGGCEYSNRPRRTVHIGRSVVLETDQLLADEIERLIIAGGF
jgi:hypothetical protein